MARETSARSIREEPAMRGRILEALADGPLTVPEIAAAVGCPEPEVMFWVMGMRKYGYVVECKGADGRLLPVRGRREGAIG